MATQDDKINVQDSPAFIRLEGKVDNLTSEIREYKLLVEKHFVTRTEFEVFKATISPNNHLISDIIKYVIIFIIGAGLALLLKTAT